MKINRGKNLNQPVYKKVLVAMAGAIFGGLTGISLTFLYIFLNHLL